MKRFLILHYGFEKPLPDEMEKWMAWINEITPHTIEMGHCPTGMEINHAGQKELPLKSDALSGMWLINAEDMAAAEELASGMPFHTAIRIYEVTGG